MWAGASSLSRPIHAQIPTSPAEAQRLLQQDPEAVRRMIQQSGLSNDEIRARLRAMGYPTDQLDAFLSGEPIDADTALDSQTVSALEALGVARETPDGIELVPLQTGMQPSRAAPDSAGAFPIFGLDVFTRGTTRFQPLLSGPVPDNYRVGPGDRMVIVLTGDVELVREVEVTREGFIVIQDVGQIPVANLPMGDVRALLRSRLARSYSGIDRGTVTFNVTISELRTNQIYVTGEVNQPGAYQLSSVATVLNALYAAAGPTRLGNMRRVEVNRRTGERVTLDLYPYLLEGDVDQDVILEQGDNVHIPLRGRRVQMRGAVVRPAYYELADSDALIDVLRNAGGFGPEALRRRLTIHRVLLPADRGSGLADRQAIDLELRASADSTLPNYMGGVLIPPIGLQDGDSIVVDSVPTLEDGYYVTIAGRVRAPDRYPWHEGMTLRELVEVARGPIVGADLREAEVSRLPEDRGSGQLARSIMAPMDSSYLVTDAQGGYRGAPGIAFPPAGSSPEFDLEPYDQVLIKLQPDFEMPRAVAISGEVSIPGHYTLLSKSDHVAELVARAGGILETGYPEGARLYRSLDDLGRIDLDLPTALSDSASSDNIILQPGDSLHIPQYSPTVTIRGAVNSPVTAQYREGEDLGYYIAAAGGYRSDADEGRVSVRYANGQARTRSKFLFWSNYPNPGPGSEVNVPVQDPDAGIDWGAVVPPTISALGTITALIIAVTR
ncbi:MAG: SLBB domain-containing protein [Gemmatimonadota bacterium]|jgi:protein involved in polysaccharide export with SLBB domain